MTIAARSFALLCVSSAVLLSACSSGTVKNTLGLSRSSPDEFRVVPRPALSVPPQFNLRPPASAAEAANIDRSNNNAQALITGREETFTRSNTGTADTAVMPVSSTTLGKTDPATGAGASSADSQFLSNAGAAKADPNIRTALMQDKLGTTDPEAVDEPQEAPWWDLFGTTTATPAEPVVAPGKEKERIQTNKQEGKPVTEGETPTTKVRDRGVLGKILGD